MTNNDARIVLGRTEDARSARSAIEGSCFDSGDSLGGLELSYGVEYLQSDGTSNSTGVRVKPSSFSGLHYSPERTGPDRTSSVPYSTERTQVSEHAQIAGYRVKLHWDVYECGGSREEKAETQCRLVIS